MSNLLVNDITRAEIDSFLHRPGHALLLSGPEGSGRLALAKSLASELLDVKMPEAGSSFNLVLPDDKDSISIDRIRELKQLTKLKSPARRVIIIADADKMSSGAQNSFLKLFEEPPENTIFVLTAVAAGLKPTIISRTQRIRVRPTSLDSAKSYFRSDEAAVERAFQITGGRLGLMNRILNSDEQTLLTAAEDARLILTSDHFQRLCLVQELSKDQDRLTAILDVLTEMAEKALAGAGSDATAARWHKVLAACYRAENAIRGRSNAKLVLTELMLNV